MPITLVHDPLELRTLIADYRNKNNSIGLVPTMGALHEGHLSLVREAFSKCDVCVLTIFVNPTQFGPNEDFGKYPRTLPEDLRLLGTVEPEKPILVFSPELGTIYPDGFDTQIEVGALANTLEGTSRPGHFRGVATIVLKLLNIAGADCAFFGQKDLQQALVIRKMVADLNVSTRIVVCPIIREPDGLAMSSRNRYLSPKERDDAVRLHDSLEKARSMISAGEQTADTVKREIERIIMTASSAKMDYTAILDPLTLRALKELSPETPVAILLAVHIGATRLIDNCIING